MTPDFLRQDVARALAGALAKLPDNVPCEAHRLEFIVFIGEAEAGMTMLQAKGENSLVSVSFDPDA